MIETRQRKQSNILFELREPDFESGVSVFGAALVCLAALLFAGWCVRWGEIEWGLGSFWMLAALSAVGLFFSWLSCTFFRQGYQVMLLSSHEESIPFRESAHQSMDLHISRRFLGQTDMTIPCVGIRSFEIKQKKNAVGENAYEVAALYANDSRVVLIPEMSSILDAQRFVNGLSRHILS